MTCAVVGLGVMGSMTLLALAPTGALTVGAPGDPRVAVPAARAGTEVVGAAAARERFPQLLVDDGECVVVDGAGGLLAAGDSVRAALGEATRLGARVRPATPVASVTRAGDHAVVTTTTGERTAVRAVIVATGRWTDHHDAAFAARLQPRRVVLTWFDVATPAAFRSAAFPPGLRVGPATFSFFPTVDTRTIKINMQVPQPTVPDQGLCHPPVEPGYARAWRLPRYVRRIGATPARTESYVESYTSARRGLVRLRDDGFRTVALGGFSGQGFKYAPAVGEVAAELAVAGRSPATAAFA